MPRLKRRKEFWNTATIGASGAFLAIALILEYGFDQAPCALCLTQRIFMGLAGVIAVFGLWHNPRMGIYPVLAIASLLTGAGFAIRQIYIQVNPEAAAACGMDLELLVEYDYPLMDILKAMTTGTGSCAEPSLIPAAALAGFAILLAFLVLQLKAAK